MGDEPPHRVDRCFTRLAGFTLACAAGASALVALPAAAIEDPVNGALDRVAIVHTSSGVGAAFSVGENHFLTAAHVVEDSGRVDLSLGDASFGGRVVATDVDLDLALLATDMRVAALRLRDDAARIGEDVFAVGAPLGGLSVSRGIVSGMRDVGGFDHIQTDAAVNGGNSGGPLLDAEGRVLGVIVSKFADAEGMAMAVPVSQIQSFMGTRPARDSTLALPDPDGAARAVGRPKGSQLGWLVLPAVAAAGLVLGAVPRHRRRRPIKVELDP